MPADPVQQILDAIAALDKGTHEVQRRRLADELVEVACDSRTPLGDFVSILQYKLLESPASIISKVLDHQAKRIAPTIQALQCGAETARKIRRKTDQVVIRKIKEYKRDHTWKETNSHFGVADGTCQRRLRRAKIKK
jgi:hypothetical protein